MRKLHRFLHRAGLRRKSYFEFQVSWAYCQSCRHLEALVLRQCYCPQQDRVPHLGLSFPGLRFLHDGGQCVSTPYDLQTQARGITKSFLGTLFKSAEREEVFLLIRHVAETAPHLLLRENLVHLKNYVVRGGTRTEGDSSCT